MLDQLGLNPTRTHVVDLRDARLKEKYQALRLVISVIRVTAGLGLAAGIGMAFFAVAGRASDIMEPVGVAIGGMLAALLLFGFSEVLQVVIDIEENTRRVSLGVRSSEDDA